MAPAVVARRTLAGTLRVGARSGRAGGPAAAVDTPTVDTGAVTSPEPAAADRPALDRDRLVVPAWVHRVEIVAESRSTNADLLARAGSEPAGSVLVAEFQSAGRGRLDRTWVSPPRAGLTMSVLIRPAPAVSTWGWLPLMTGVALHEAVTAEVADVPTPALKWPNDLLLDGRKAAGILAQAAGPAVVLGLGLNVSTTAAELPGAEAVSLALAAGVVPDRTRLLSAVLERLGRWLDRWTEADGDAESAGLAAEYRSRCATIGAEVLVRRPGGAFSGRAVAVDAAGRLVVHGRNGPVALSAGDVTHVRPAGG